MARSGQASASDSETGPSPESRTPRSGVVNAGGIPFFQEGRTVYSREDMYKQRDSAVRPQMNEELSGTVYEEDLSAQKHVADESSTVTHLQPKRREGPPRQLKIAAEEVKQMKEVARIIEEAEGGAPPVELMDDMPSLLEGSAERPAEGEPPPLYDAEDALDDLPALQEASPVRGGLEQVAGAESDTQVKALMDLIDKAPAEERQLMLQTFLRLAGSQPPQQSHDESSDWTGGGGPAVAGGPSRRPPQSQPPIPVAHPLNLPEAMPLQGALNPNASSFQPGARGEFADMTSPNSQLSMLVEQIQSGSSGPRLEDMMLRGMPQRAERSARHACAPPMVSPSNAFGVPPRGLNSGNNSQQNSPLQQPFFPPPQNSPLSGPALSPNMMPGPFGGHERKQTFLTPVQNPHGPSGRHGPQWSPSQVSSGYPPSTRSAPVFRAPNQGPIPGAPIKPARTPAGGAPMMGHQVGRQSFASRVRLEDKFSAMDAGAPSDRESWSFMDQLRTPPMMMCDPGTVQRLPVPWQTTGAGPVLPPRPPGMLDSQVEDSEHRLKQRQKQIEFGMATQGYLNYVRAKERGFALGGRIEPHIPNIYQKCSKRSWDGQVRLWRQHLHAFDDLTAHLWTPQEQDEIKRKLLADEQRRQMLKERNQIAVGRDALSCGHTAVSSSEGSCPGLAM
eukprot:Hpha_TRINITY_DN12231_c0_g1::TRINITY_DN12231_c0_g1_i1::g.17119::m.17119